ncbi:MAG: MerR family transcriptional regulator [Anaerolineales bacterium]|nr:MerR family transcriptional regulator [Anaerolineales bacterium]
MTLSKNPAFNLKAVLQETNIAADTLRAWERRYGLPMPQRTAGGHRLYSQYDIETVKWLIARQSEGLSISRAVDSWNEKIASGADPLADVAPSAFSASQAALAISTSTNTSLDTLRTQWITACINFKESNAEQILNQAFSIFPVESVCTEVLQKGLVEIGSLWYQNRASVQQEHFASGLAMRRLDALLSASPAPSRNKTVLVGCPPNEWHTFTPLLISLLLRRRGLNVIYLGANVPTQRFAETITTVKADLVILVAQTLTSAATLQNTALALKELHLPIGFGGRIFNLQSNLVEHIPGHYLGNEIFSSLEEVERLLKGKVNENKFKATPQQYLVAHRAFISKRTHIESTFKELTQHFSANPEDSNTGIQFLGDNIIAALQLGDMAHVSEEIEWLKTLLQSHERPVQELAGFMQNYSRAVDQHINGHGNPLKDWLKMQLQSIN